MLGCCFLSCFAACEEEKAQPDNLPIENTVAVPPSAAPTPAATPAAAPADEPKTRPMKVDTELTAERRAALDAKYPKAKGFLSAAELEAKLKADATVKEKKGALAAFDRAARGKWLLFTGPIVNLTETGFDLVIVYTPQLPNDPMGMSRQFFEITFSDIEGYAKEDFKTGNMGVVLAQYNGDAKASPGYEVVATDVWQ
jgi:hypothetical protein